MIAFLALRVADHTVPLITIWATGHGLANRASGRLLPAGVRHARVLMVKIFAELMDRRAKVISLRLRQRLIAVGGEIWPEAGFVLLCVAIMQLAQVTMPKHVEGMRRNSYAKNTVSVSFMMLFTL